MPGSVSPTSLRVSTAAGWSGSMCSSCSPRASSWTPILSTSVTAGGGSAGRWCSSHSSVRATICRTSPVLRSLRRGTFTFGELENNQIAATAAKNTARIPLKPIPSTASPAAIAASTIVSSEPPISLIRVIRFFRRSSAEPRPIGCSRTRRWRPPARLSRSRARPSSSARSVSSERFCAIRAGSLGGEERRLLHRLRGLGLALGAGDVALSLLDFAREHLDGLLHAGERLDLEGVDRVHRVVDVLERALQRLHRDRARGRLLVDLGGVVAQQLAGRIDDPGGGLVERGDLLQH